MEETSNRKTNIFYCLKFLSTSKSSLRGSSTNALVFAQTFMARMDNLLAEMESLMVAFSPVNAVTPSRHRTTLVSTSASSS